MSLAPPEPLRTSHRTNEFDSGVATLDDWLNRRALANHMSGASRTFVLCEQERIVGYYALASRPPAGSVETCRSQFQLSFSGGLRWREPVRARASVAFFSGTPGFKWSTRQTPSAFAGVDRACDLGGSEVFYLRLGLMPSPGDPMTLMVTLADLRAAVEVR